MTFRVLTVVAAAILDDQGRVLLAQRPEGKSMAGLWEFPGGKLENGESPEAALVRELHEELRIELSVDDLKPLTFASHAYEDFHLLMPLYELRVWKGDPHPAEGQSLRCSQTSLPVCRHSAHSEKRYVRGLNADLHTFPAPAADVPLFEYLAGRSR